MILKDRIPFIVFEILISNGKIIKNSKYLFMNHGHMLDNFRFFGMLIFSFIFYIYEKKSSKSELNMEKSNASKSEKGCFKDIKNVNEKKEYDNKKILLNLNILIIIAICLILEFSEDIFSILNIFSNWMIFLLIASYINSKMFKLVTYKHQKLAIYFNFITSFIFQLSSFILILRYRDAINEKENIYINYLSLWLLPLGFIILFIYAFISSYTYSKIKWIMDLKQVAMTKIFIIYSLLGFIMNIITSVILTYNKCEREIIKYFCKISDNENNLYLDNIFVFFDNISKIYEINKNYLILIIFLIFTDIIFNSLYNYFYFLILKNLSLEFFVFTDSIGKMFNEIIEIFIRKIAEGNYFAEGKKDNKILFIKFLFGIIGNFLGFIGFLVYSEIIELNFCGDYYNLRRKIIERSIEESIQRISINDDQSESLFNDNALNTELSLSFILKYLSKIYLSLFL